jgi:hypothetical protein
MLARRSKGQLQLFPLALGLHFGAADPRLQLQQFQLRVGELLAIGAVLFDPHQSQSFFQYPHLVLCELESLPNNAQRAVELFK